MPIATNDTIDKYGSQVTLVASGAAIAAGAFSADVAAWTTVESLGAPDIDLVLEFTPAALLAGSPLINIFVRPVNINGTNDAPVPSAAYKNDYKGSFKCEATAALQTLSARIKNVPPDCEIYLENASGQIINAGWLLKATPKTVGPSA